MNELKAYEYTAQYEGKPETQAADYNEILKRYQPVVKKIGLHLKSKLPPQFELADLMQVGMLGLINAVDNYDESHGASFETYARIRIRGAMLDEIRRTGWTSRSLQQKSKAVSDAMKSASSRLGREAGDAEIAEEMGLNINDYHQISGELVSTKVVSFEAFTEDQEMVSSMPNPFDILEDDAFKGALREAIDTLPEKEKMVMSLYYNNEMNLKEIGMILEVSESRVCQIHGQALARVKSRMQSWVK